MPLLCPRPISFQSEQQTSSMYVGASFFCSDIDLVCMQTRQEKAVAKVPCKTLLWKWPCNKLSPHSQSPKTLSFRKPACFIIEKNTEEIQIQELQNETYSICIHRFQSKTSLEIRAFFLSLKLPCFDYKNMGSDILP